MDKIPSKIQFKKVYNTAGHLSAKLVLNTPNGEVWKFYDTRLETEDPKEGTIIVFNSATGLYEKCTNLADAKKKFEEHYARLTITVPVIPIGKILKPMRDPSSVEFTHDTTGIIFL